MTPNQAAGLAKLAAVNFDWLPKMPVFPQSLLRAVNEASVFSRQVERLQLPFLPGLDASMRTFARHDSELHKALASTASMTALASESARLVEAVRLCSQPALDFAAAMKPFTSTLTSFAEALLPFREHQWAELGKTFANGTRSLVDAFAAHAEELGRAGWTVPLNATLGDCIALLESVRDPASVDAAFVAFYMSDDKTSLRLLLGEVKADPRLRDFRRLLSQAAGAADREEFELAITGLLTVFEAASRRSWNSDFWIAKRRNEWLEDKLNSLHSGSYDALVLRATGTFIESLYAQNHDGDPKPESLNRHWILHGRGPADGNVADYLRLLQGIHTVLTMADDREGAVAADAAADLVTRAQDEETVPSQ